MSAFHIHCVFMIISLLCISTTHPSLLFCETTLMDDNNISIVINTNLNLVFINVTTLVSAPLTWTGFGFGSTQMLDTYAIIVDYSFPQQLPTIYETTLGNHNIGTLYANSETTVLSDTNDGVTRNVNLQRAIIGTYSFPSTSTTLHMIAAVGIESNFPQCTGKRQQSCQHAPLLGRRTASIALNELEPTGISTNTPSVSPTSHPSLHTTKASTNNPSRAPSVNPTFLPSVSPIYLPSVSPSSHPSLHPIKASTNNPSTAPSVTPIYLPSLHPTNFPSFIPTNIPSFSPTHLPSIHPTNVPTLHPSNIPTTKPSSDPSVSPTTKPTKAPSLTPTVFPTSHPSLTPTIFPTLSPTSNPAQVPTLPPSNDPSVNLSVEPTLNPTYEPITSVSPTSYPTYVPSQSPIYTANPTDILYSTQAIESSQSTTNAPIKTIKTDTEIICDDDHSCYKDIVCSSGDCVVACNSDDSCKWSNIYSFRAQSLTIECNKDSSCKQANIFGGNALFVMVKCNGFESCKGTNFYGNDTNLLSIHCLHKNGSCQDMKVFCPLDHKQCVISNDGINSNDIHRNLELYAVHGFDDLDISRYKAALISHDVYDNVTNMMHCGTDYASFCALNASLFCACEYKSIETKISYAEIAGFIAVLCVVLVIFMAIIGLCMFFIHSLWNSNEDTKPTKRKYKTVNFRSGKTNNIKLRSIHRYGGSLQAIQEEDTDDTDESDYDKTQLYPLNTEYASEKTVILKYI